MNINKLNKTERFKWAHLNLNKEEFFKLDRELDLEYLKDLPEELILENIHKVYDKYNVPKLNITSEIKFKEILSYPTGLENISSDLKLKEGIDLLVTFSGNEEECGNKILFKYNLSNMELVKKITTNWITNLLMDPNTHKLNFASHDYYSITMILEVDNNKYIVYNAFPCSTGDIENDKYIIPFSCILRKITEEEYVKISRKT